MKFLDARAVTGLTSDGAERAYRGRRVKAFATPWLLTYTAYVPMSTRSQTHTYRVYLPPGEDPMPFILVRGERAYLPLELATKVLS